MDTTLGHFATEVGREGPVGIRGAGTRWEFGGSLAPDARELRAPGGIVDYRPEEMTVRVRTGTTVADLHEELRARGQRTALAERGGTVGGALAVGEDDLRALRRGKVRGALLEVTYVSADGRVVRGGAPTVKNVSGFDVPRLMVGALGTLGLLAEAVLRTAPIPAHARWLYSGDADPFVVRELATSAAAILWNGVGTFVELEGHLADVDDDTERLGTVASWTEAEGPPTLPACRCSLRPSDLRAIDAEQTGAFVASIGTGLLLSERAQPPRPVPAGVRALAARVKLEFDPSGRLNPGRDPMGAER